MIRRTAVALLVVSQMTGCASGPPKSREQVLTDLATAFVQQLGKGDFDEASRTLGPPLTFTLSAEKLKAQWEMVTGKVGAFKSIVETRTEPQESFTAVSVTCAFEKQNVKVITSFDDQSRIVRLFYDPR